MPRQDYLIILAELHRYVIANKPRVAMAYRWRELADEVFRYRKENYVYVQPEVPERCESDRKKEILDHKFALAISSPLFYAMFYGQIAETKDSIAIELPDCEHESLLEMFRYLGGDNESERK